MAEANCAEVSSLAVSAGPRPRCSGRDGPAPACSASRCSIGQAGPGLLVPRCRSVHTFGMRVDLDVHFLDAAGESTSVLRAVPPNRLVWDRRAVDVLEVPSGSGEGGESGSPSP